MLKVLTIENDLVCVVEVDAVVRVWEEMDIVVFHAREIEFVEQRGSILHMYVVVGNAVHDQETHILGQILDVVDAGVVVASWVVLRSVHVPLRVDGVWKVSRVIVVVFNRTYRKISNL